ncbi:hypothetical protein, partial [Enterococcus casseliflavus]|uniref:hypothetical protein n=1 Tax=Enterococcus casseliflavus TaxID=37734 RepID=UPI0022E0EEF3
FLFDKRNVEQHEKTVNSVLVVIQSLLLNSVSTKVSNSKTFLSKKGNSRVPFFRYILFIFPVYAISSESREKEDCQEYTYPFEYFRNFTH